MSPLLRPSRDEVAVFRSRADFIAWLDEHHATSDGLWIGYYRRGVGRTSISYTEAVEAGLAFGWVDSLTYRVDDEVHTNRFTPRRKGSNWSLLNVARVDLGLKTEQLVVFGVSPAICAAAFVPGPVLPTTGAFQPPADAWSPFTSRRLAAAMQPTVRWRRKRPSGCPAP